MRLSLLTASYLLLVSCTLGNPLTPTYNESVSPRDASTYTASQLPLNREGEDHSEPAVPSGSILTSLPVGSLGNQLAAYWSSNPNNSSAKQAFVMVHGRLRKGDDYFTTLQSIVQSAIDDDYPNVDENSILVAPQFYSTKLNLGQYASNQLSWQDVNAWQAGEIASHPENNQVSSFDALDAFIDEFSNQNKYPVLQHLVFIGHGGGGQLLNRYAIVGKDSPDNLNIRYIAGDSSSFAYFTKDRPVTDDSIASISTCPLYNTWRYGFDNFTLPTTNSATTTGNTQPSTLLTPKQYFARAIKRDVRYIVGYQDTVSGGDQYCMAILQGGIARRDRNLAWWKYLNLLARTDENVSGFPGNFTNNLPDWSSVVETFSHKLTVIQDAGHDATKVFGSKQGRAVLFVNDDSNVPTGWRPIGWKPMTVTPSSSSFNSSMSSSSSSSSSSPWLLGSPSSNTLSNSATTTTTFFHNSLFLELFFGFHSILWFLVTLV